MRVQRGISIFVLLGVLLFLTGCLDIMQVPWVSEGEVMNGDRDPALATDDESQSRPIDDDPHFYQAITEETAQLMNAERRRSGQSSLFLNKQLSKVAEWVAMRYLSGEEGVTIEEVQAELDPYPELAATTFALNQVSAVGANTNRYVQWFAGNIADDITQSQNVRNNLLNPEIRQVGVACVGKAVIVEGKEQYKMIFVWIFAPEPPPAGIIIYERIANDNISILNTERNNLGLGMVQPHSILMSLAQLKAEDILRNLAYDELAHESEALGSPHEMIIAELPSSKSTAENLWTQYGSFHENFMSETAQQAHTGLMNSQGHRENMLEPSFTHIGVGVAGGIVDGESGKLYKVVLVQLFINQ